LIMKQTVDRVVAAMSRCDVSKAVTNQPLGMSHSKQCFVVAFKLAPHFITVSSIQIIANANAAEDRVILIEILI